jgi:hypothetical protein
LGEHRSCGELLCFHVRWINAPGEIFVPVDPINQHIGTGKTRLPAPATVGSPPRLAALLFEQDVPDACEKLPRSKETQKRFSRHSLRPVFMRRRGRPSLVNLGACVWHGLTTSDCGPRDLGAEIGGVFKQVVPSLTGLFPVLGFQRHSHSLCCVIGAVDGVVTPIGAVVVPNVVVGIGMLRVHAPTSSEGVGHPPS